MSNDKDLYIREKARARAKTLQDRALVELGVREDPQKLEYALARVDELTKANAELQEKLSRARVDELTKANAELQEKLSRAREELLCIKQRRD